MKVGAFDHPKMFHLAHLLQTDRWQARGLVESIFIVTSQFAIRGDIGHLRNQAIACKMDYKGDSDHMARCLVDSGWLDEHPEHRLVVHNWHKHCPPWVKGQMSQVEDGFVGNGPSSNSSPKGDSLNPTPIPIPIPGKGLLRASLGPPKGPLRDSRPSTTPSETELWFDGIVGGPAPPGIEPHGLPPDPTESPETSALALPKVVWDALVRFKGSPAAVSPNLKNRAMKHADAYGPEAVAKALDELKAEDKPWADLGHRLNAQRKKEYEGGKPTRPDIDAAEVRRAAQRAREHPEDDRPVPTIDFTAGGSS